MGMSWSLAEIAQLLNCEGAFEGLTVTGAEIDTRRLQSGHLFIALKGSKTDGHAYIEQARKAGASAAIVSEKQADPLPQLVVTDVQQAFTQLARTWCQKTHAKIVAITGSNGKTSVKEMVSAILKQAGQVTSTQGNFNNDLGVPLTLCRMDMEDDYAVIEMGANHHGEIANLVKIATPDVALINNVAPAHLEGFGSIEGVAQAKGEIYAGLAENGVGIVNADMPFIALWQTLLAGRETISFALENDADITANCIQLDESSIHFLVKMDEVNHHFNLALSGKHNVANALAAIAVCRALHIPVEAMVKGLASMACVPHRLQLRQGQNNSRLLDDTYNANPGSYLQALNAMSAFHGVRWLVLGDFGELGEDCVDIHKQMGRQAREAGIGRLFTVGEMSQYATNTFGEQAEHFRDIETLQSKLESELHQDVVCLIKGSRFMQLDKLADKLAVGGEA